MMHACGLSRLALVQLLHASIWGMHLRVVAMPEVLQMYKLKGMPGVQAVLN